MEEAMNVSYWIRRRRELLGMTQEELAKKLGYKSKSSINKIENGRRKLPRKMVREFSEALFCSPSDLSVDLTGRLEIELVGRINELPDEDKLAILRFIDYVCDKRAI